MNTENRIFSNQVRITINDGKSEYEGIIKGIACEFPEYIMYIVEKAEGLFDNGYSCANIPSTMIMKNC